MRMKKGDFSKFIEEAVRWRVFDQTIAEARSRFVDLEASELQWLIEKAVSANCEAARWRSGAYRNMPSRDSTPTPTAVEARRSALFLVASGRRWRVASSR